MQKQINVKQAKEKSQVEELPKNRLPLTSDYVFKRVFAKDENNSMLKDFLEAILNININNVIVKNPEIPRNLADEKMGVLEIHITQLQG